MKNKTLGIITACGALILNAQQVHATTAELLLRDPSNLGLDQIILDNGPGDLNPLPGVIVFNGAFSSFLINVSTGTSAPLQAGPYPHLDLSSININVGAAAGSVIIGFTDVNQSAPNLGMATAVGGTMSGGINSVEFDSYVDTSNTPFGMGTAVNSFAFSNTAAYSASGTGPVTVNDPYSASIFATINSTGSGSASFDLEFKPVPDAGNTALLLGSSVSGLIAFARRKK